MYSEFILNFATQRTLRTMENKEALDTLHDIKNLMEKSTKFLSISGISSILVGIYACIGTGVAYYILAKPGISTTITRIPFLNVNTSQRLTQICIVALVVLVLSLVTVFTMSYRKAIKANRNIFTDKSVYRLLWNFFLPLFTGGVLCVSLLWHHHYGLTSSIMLIFYGLSLVNCSKYTYSDIRYLGYAEILLGLIDSFVVNHALVFWVIGFGLLHIAAGIYFYYKVERRQALPSPNTRVNA